MGLFKWRNSWVRRLSIFLIVFILSASPVFAYYSEIKVTGGSNVIMKRLLQEMKTGKSQATSVSTSCKSEKEANRIVNSINNKYFKYWNTASIYVSEYPDGFVFVVYPERNSVEYKINQVLNKKAKKIAKTIKKKSSKVSRIKKAARGVARELSYKWSGYKNYEIVTLKNLRKGKGYCLVYSLLFQAVCDRVGLSCQCVLGDAGGYHSWNRVRVGGSWRYVDTAWYDSGKSKKYLYSKKLWSTHTVQSIIKAWQ